MFSRWHVQLTPEDMEVVKRVAHQRNDIKEAHQIKARYQMNREMIASHIMGVAAEYAVAKAFNVEIDYRWGLRGDLGYDLIINRWRCDVKCSPRVGYDFVLNATNPHTFGADYGILAYQEGADCYFIYGVISKERIITKGRIRDFGYGPRWCVSPEFLIGPEVLETRDRE